jgi:chemotaxis protein CheC
VAFSGGGKLTKRKTEVFETRLSRWTELVKEGTEEALSGLSRMVGKKIRITAFDLKVIPVSEVADMVGGAEKEVVSIYVGITGIATGHIMLVYPQQVAFGLVDMLMDCEYGTTRELGTLEASALAEVGNITGSFLLNSMAYNLGMRLMPTPPQVMVDMLGAVLSIPLTDIMKHRDDLFMMSTVFATEGQSIIGTLLVMPSGELMDLLVEEFSE